MAPIWIGASYALGRDVPIDQPYPHVCGASVNGRMTPHLMVRLLPRDCAACAEERHRTRTTKPPRKDGTR